MPLFVRVALRLGMYLLEEALCCSLVVCVLVLHWEWRDRLSISHAQRLLLPQRRVHRRRRRSDCTSGLPPHIVGVSVTDVPLQRLVTAVFQAIDGSAQPNLKEYIPICMTIS